MFKNQKLKRKATSAIAEVAEVALCASNCALPTIARGGVEVTRLEAKAKDTEKIREKGQG